MYGGETGIGRGKAPHSASLRSAPLPHDVGERKGAKHAAGASSPPSIGGEVPSEARRSGGRPEAINSNSEF